jgi:hypothetical protein
MFFCFNYNHNPNKIKQTNTIIANKFDKNSPFMILRKPKDRLSQHEQGLAPGCIFWAFLIAASGEVDRFKNSLLKNSANFEHPSS